MHRHHPDEFFPHTHDHGPGHNHAPDGAGHLHSHVHGSADANRAEELKVLAEAFVDGFRKADDKTAYLRLAGIPFDLDGTDGLKMHLVDAAITSNWQIGTASPAFGSRELVYMPFPGSMVAERESMVLTYVSLTERRDVDVREFLEQRVDAG
ncbi:MAG: hypothetical protein AAGL24_19620 [Pseudomonadota bacterium]